MRRLQQAVLGKMLYPTLQSTLDIIRLQTCHGAFAALLVNIYVFRIIKIPNPYIDNIHFQAITAETVHLKFEKSRSQLQESLRRVESIVTEDIGHKVCCAKF